MENKEESDRFLVVFVANLRKKAGERSGVIFAMILDPLGNDLSGHYFRVPNGVNLFA